MPDELQNYINEWIDPNEHIPAELLLDDHHPAADAFHQNRTELEQKIFAFSRALKPKKREFCRLLRTNLKTKEIAAKLSVSVPTVHRWAKEPEIIRLTTLMHHHQHLLDGATAEHRKGILWRIALNNEEKRPNIAIQALQEINKMSNAYGDGNQGNGNNVVQIQINGDILPRGALDQLPDTYENRVIEGKISGES